MIEELKIRKVGEELGIIFQPCFCCEKGLSVASRAPSP